MNIRALSIYAFLAFVNTLSVAQDCSISNITVQTDPCVNGEFLAVIDFDVENPQSERFGIVGNINYGEFDYADLPVTVGPLAGDGETEWTFTVFDRSAIEECSATFELGAVSCCEFRDIVVQPQQCNDTETFSAILNFNRINTGNVGFNLFDGNNNLIGIYTYAELPVLVDGIPSSGIGDDAIIICDLSEDNCCTRYEFSGPDCDPNDCEIYDLAVDIQECERGQFEVVLDFISENPGPTFAVAVNNVPQGSFPYSSLPLTIGPFDGDAQTEYTISVEDADDGTCGADINVGPVDCPEICRIDSLTAGPVECQGNFNYSLAVDFVPSSPGEDGFTVYSGQTPVGQFSYDELPVIVDSFPASGQFFDTLVICDNADSLCCEFLEFQALLCDECIIYDVTATRTACDSNQQFFVELDFKFQNESDSGFQVGGNGVTYGQFAYSDLPIALGPFNGDNQTAYEFVIFDLENGLCIGGTQLGAVDCITPCKIDGLLASPMECTGDGIYELLVGFTPVDSDTTGFAVFAGDQLIGEFNYDSLPLLIPDFPASGGAADEVTVCDLADPFCCASFSFESPGCFEICSISNLSVSADSCTSDSTFSVTVNFTHEFLTTDSFDIAYANRSERRAIADLPLNLTGLRSDQGNLLFTVTDINESSCADSLEITTLRCDTACFIGNLGITSGTCRNDGSYDAQITFDSENLGGDSVVVVLNDSTIATFSVGAEVITLENLRGDSSSNIIRICDGADTMCCGELSYTAPLCEIDTCNIRGLNLDDIVCMDDGTFEVNVDLVPDGVAGDSLDILIDSVLWTSVHRDSLPVRLTGVIGDGEQRLLQVCGTTDQGCCADTVFVAPICEIDSCDFRDLTLRNIACGDEGTFSVEVDLIPGGVTSPFLVITNNDSLAGIVPVDSLPVTLQGIQGTGELAVLKACDSANPECCVEIEYQMPVCEIECAVLDLNVSETICLGDGTFDAAVTFGTRGFESDSVDISVNGGFVGTYAVMDTPLNVGAFVGQEQTIELTVCESGNSECCSSIFFNAPDCPGCTISNLTADVTDCTSDSTFGAWLDFDILGLDTNGVDIYANDNFIGFFPLVKPLLVSNIPADTGTIRLEVCSAGGTRSPGCCTSTNIPGADCAGPECIIGQVNAEASDCDSALQYTVSVDIDLLGSSQGAFILAGNGTTYGSYAYEQLPVTIGPFEYDSLENTPLEFIAIDLTDPSCSNSTEIGPVECMTTSVLSAPAVAELEVWYSGRDVYVRLPASRGELMFWSSNGALSASPGGTAPGSVIRASEYVRPGLLYIVTYRTGQTLYTGRFTLMD